MNRTKISTKNVTFALGSQFLILLGQFVLQTIFVKKLSASYLGANGLFTNLVSFLSFAELGIGSAITYSLYGPLANEDHGQVNAIMTLFKKVYEIVGSTILIVGFLLSFFVNDLVKTGHSIPHIQYLFILYLLGTVVSYFFTYTRSLLIANQDGYINSINQVVFKIIQIVMQIIALIFTEDYAIYLIIVIVTTLLSNIRITLVTFKRFKFLNLKSRNKILPSVLTRLRQNVVGTISSKIGEIVVFGTDNILISKFIGLATVGVYSNYTLIINGINSVLNQGLSALISSFGNLGVTEKNTHQREIFYDYLYIVVLITFILSSTFFTVVQIFIKIWFGQSFIFSNFTVFLITINFILTELRQATLGFISALGLFWPMRYKSIIEASLNLILSFVFILGFDLGLKGVLLGTLCSTVFVNLWWEPLVLFKYGFRSSIKPFALKFLKYLIVIVVTQIIILKIVNYINIRNIGILFLFAVFLVLFYTTVFIILFFKTTENKYFLVLLKKIIFHFMRRDKY